jgi:hypothetical protein
VCWSTSSTADPGSSEWLPYDVEATPAGTRHGQEVDCLQVRERAGRLAGAKAVKKEERWCRATGEMELWRCWDKSSRPAWFKAHCKARLERPACNRIGFER